MATNTTTIKFVGQFDSSGITKGLQDIKKQMSNTHIGEDLRKQLETALNKVEVNIPALEKMSAKGEFNFKEIQNYQKILTDVSKDMNNLLNLADKADFTKAFSSADTEKLKQFEKQLSDVENKIKSTKKEIIKSFEESEKNNGRGGNKTLNGVIEQLISVPPDQMKDKLDEIIQEAEKQTLNAREELQNIFKDAKYAHGGDNAVEFLFGKDSGVTIAEKKKTEIKDTFNAIRKEIQAFNEDTAPKDVEETLNKLINLVNSESLLNTEGKQSVLGNLLPKDVLERLKELANKVPELKQILGTGNLKILNEQEAEKIRLTAEQVNFLENRLKELVEAKKITIDQANLITQSLNKQEGEVKDLSEQYKKQQAQTEALNATFGGLVHRIENSISALAVFNKSMQIIRSAIKSVEDLDAAFTQIAIVSEQSNEAAWKMFDSFNSLAKQYSITTKDLTEGAKLFYQQGLNAADTMKMVEASTISAALGEVTMTEAANTLTAAIQGYNESAAVAMDYTDKIAMVGAVSAADFNELSTAMEKTASSAYTAGIDFDHLLGYLGKMIEVTREAPANLGTAMKTIIARFEDMKKDPMAILEDGVSANKVEAALSTIGIALRNSEGEFRALQDVMDELGMKWNSLTRNQQAYIATVAAGSRQQSRFLALMNNYDRTLDLITESQNSAGAAAQQYATYQDSITAAQNRLTASWEKFYSKIVDNSAIKFAINSLSKLVEVLSNIPPAITAIGAAFGALQLQGFIRSNGKDLLTTIFGKITTDESGVKQIGDNIVQGLFKSIKDNLQKQQGKTVEEFAKQFKISGDSISNVGEGINKSLGKIPENLKNIGSGFVTVGKAIVGFVVANWEIIAVATAVAGAIYLINRALTANKRKYEENIQSIKDYQEQASELTSKVNTAESLLDTYDELSTKINRTTEEQNELNSTIESLVELYPNAIEYTDEYGNKHLENSNILRGEIELEKQLARERNRTALEQREKLLEETDRKEWKKEDFEAIGFNTTQVSTYFSNEDKLKILRENALNYSSAGDLGDVSGQLYYLNNEFVPNYKKVIHDLNEINSAAALGFEELNESATKDEIIDYINKLNLSDLGWDEDDILNLKNSISSIAEDADKNLQKEKNSLIDTLNELNNEYDLKLGTLEYTADDNVIIKYFEDIKNYDFDGRIKEIEDAQEKIVSRLKQDNEIQLSFLDLVYSEKQGTAQRVIASKLQAFFSSMGSEAYQAFKNSLGDTTLTEYIQAAINNITDSDTAITVSNLIEEALDPTTSQARLLEIYAELGTALGDETGENFVNGFQTAIEESRKKNREDLEETVRNAYGLNKNFSFTGYSDERLKSLNELSKYTKDFDIAYELVPYYDEVYKMTEEAAKNGSIQGIINGVNNIDTTDLDDTSKEIFENVADELTEGTIWTVTQDAFKKLQQEAEEFISNTKKSLDTIQSDGRVNAKDYGLETEDYSFGVYFDSTSGEKMVSTARVLLDIEEKNNKNLRETEKQYLNNLEVIEHLKKLGEDITDNDKKHLKELENENQALLDQYKYYQKISNITLESGWNTSIQLAKNYQSQLQTINKLEKAMAEQSGVLFLSDMEDAMSILPEFQNRFTEISDNTYTISAENIEAMKKEIKSEYDLWLAQEKAKATYEYENAVANFELIKGIAEQEGVIDNTNTEQFIENNKTELESTKTELEKTLNASYDEIKQELTAHADKDNQMVQMFDKALLAMGEHYEDFIEDIKSGNFTPIYDGLYNEIKSLDLSTTTEINIKTDLLDALKDPSKVEERKKIIEAALEQAAERVRAAWQKLSSLKEIDVPGLEQLKHNLEEAGKSAKDTEKALKAIADIIDNLTDALNDLDDLLKDIKRDLGDITVNYNPFTDLFEAWEHEWDYFYNIKRLLQQIDTQGQYIDNIISADYISADKRIEAEHAKVGNLLAKMAANDTYIEALRAGMSQTAVELMKDYGEYYKVDPTTGQLYQTDKNLNDINELMNERKQEIYDLQKLQNEKENDLNLENAKLEALEKQKSAYEDILSTIESQLDKLKDDEEITADISGLEAQKAELEAKIEVTDQSIEDAKDKIRDMEDEIQEIEVDITLKEQDFQKLEDYVSDMEDKVSEYEEYWENLNTTIAEQQELLQELNEIKNQYIETAIATEQALYDAIVENYQKEIDQKKKEYDYLKQLDNDYLQSVKDNISKERKAREDANKQRNYQQNVQRAQLLQMDTSGAYRNELANLNKEIENQRQDLYDDLVDKQVEALEKEIEKRHELYDQEVAALEERLAYYQENAILLWEKVNSIVAEGSEAMMTTLENTTAYINSNELVKDQQRRTWEYNVQKTFDGVQNNVITTLGNLVDAGNTFITEKYPEIGTALDDYKQVFIEASNAVNEYNSQLISSRDALNNDTERATQLFQGVLDSFMTTWNSRTNEFTGYAKNWTEVTNSLKQQTENNLNELENLYNEQGQAIQSAIGSIEDYDEALRDASTEIYQDFLDERDRYRDELESLVNQIETDISAAISSAASAISAAANSIEVNPSNNGNDDDGKYGGNSGDSQTWEARITYYLGSGASYTVQGIGSGNSMAEAQRKAYEEALKKIPTNAMYMDPVKYIQKFKTGGLANFTGPAWLDGTKSDPERVLSPKQTRLFESMVSSLEKTANNSNINTALGSSYNIGDINTTIQVEKLDNDTDIDKVARQVENRIMRSIKNRVTVSIR